MCEKCIQISLLIQFCNTSRLQVQPTSYYHTSYLLLNPTYKKNRAQISRENLEKIETVTKEVLLIFNPGVPLRTPGSLFSQGWLLPEELVESGLFVANHPAFLPYILRYMERQQLSAAERQTFWSGLVWADRPQQQQLALQFEISSREQQPSSSSSGSRIPAHQFYRGTGGGGGGPLAESVELSEDIDMFYRFLGDMLPSIADFINAFLPPRTTPALSVVSQGTELTESSGVSSYLPKATAKKSGGRNASAPRPPPKRQENEKKRKSWGDPEPPSRHPKKRQILKEHN
jgi:hypothetical protein